MISASARLIFPPGERKSVLSSPGVDFALLGVFGVGGGKEGKGELRMRGGERQRGEGRGGYFCPRQPRGPRLKGMRYLSGLLSSTSQRSGAKERGSGKWAGESIVERKSIDTGVYGCRQLSCQWICMLC